LSIDFSVSLSGIVPSIHLRTHVLVSSPLWPSMRRSSCQLGRTRSNALDFVDDTGWPVTHFVANMPATTWDAYKSRHKGPQSVYASDIN
jgi:hypothetical protein